MDILTNILTGNIGTAIIVLILWRSGLLKELLNGKNGNGSNKKIEELKEQITEINNNHLEHLSEKLDKIIENTTKEIYILEDIKLKINELR